MKSEREIIKYMLSNRSFTTMDIAMFLNLDISRMMYRTKSQQELKMYVFLRENGYKDAACVVRGGWNGKRFLRLCRKFNIDIFTRGGRP